jgi:hypothetical protein
MSQLIQVAGSLLIVVAYAAAQRGALNQRSLTYQVMNLVGSTVLAVEAALHQQWGFLLLEAVWAVVSSAGLYRALRERSVSGRQRPASGAARS